MKPILLPCMPKVLAGVFALALIQCGPLTSAVRGEDVSNVLRQIDHKILVAQYEELRMEVFHRELKQAMLRIKLEHAKSAQQELLRQELAEGEQVIHYLQDRLERTRAHLRESDQKSPPPGRAARPSGPLDGTWVGKEIDVGRPARMAIRGNRVELKFPEQNEWYAGTVQLGQDGEHQTCWFTIQESSNESLIGRLVKGIYRYKGKRLSLAVAEPGATEAPTRIEHSESTHLLVFEKQ